MSRDKRPLSVAPERVSSPTKQNTMSKKNTEANASKQVTAEQFTRNTDSVRKQVKAYENDKGLIDTSKVTLAVALKWLAENAETVETLVEAAKQAKAEAKDAGHGRAMASAISIVTASGKSKVSSDKLIKAAVASMKTVKNLSDLKGLIAPFIKTQKSK